MNKPIISIPDKWQNDLIWCPSQCYLEIWIEDTPYVIYLRWRHEDPWTLSLIEGATLTDFVLDDAGVWIEFEHFLPFTQFHDIELIQQYALQAVKEYFSTQPAGPQ